MIFFEHLFIIIARFYIKTWSKYKNWWVGVRYGIFILIFFNMMSVFAIIKDNVNISKLTFMIIGTSFYLIISFINPKLNDKAFVENYETATLWNKIAVTYIITSIVLFFTTFWIFIIGI
jgi:hypothetical protein